MRRINEYNALQSEYISKKLSQESLNKLVSGANHLSELAEEKEQSMVHRLGEYDFDLTYKEISYAASEYEDGTLGLRLCIEEYLKEEKNMNIEDAEEIACLVQLYFIDIIGY